MRGLIFGIGVLFLTLFSFSFVSATSCDSFCGDKGYDYGTCRETTEDLGFCEGRSEDVYGFSFCKNYERCCCGKDANTSLSKDSLGSSSTGDVTTTASSGTFAEGIFWPLAILVVLLGLSVILKNKAFRTGRKDEEKEIKEQ